MVKMIKEKQTTILALILLFSALVIFGKTEVAGAANEENSPLLAERKNLSSQERSKNIGDDTQQSIDGTFYDWAALEFKENAEDEKKCYIVSFPIKKIGNYEGEREPYILITHFQERGTEEISIYNGYEYKLNSNIYIAIDNDSNYELFTKEELAWAKTPQLDKEIIQRMLKGNIIKVRGDSAKGSYTVDEYSLKGIARAYKRMRELCEVENTKTK